MPHWSALRAPAALQLILYHSNPSLDNLNIITIPYHVLLFSTKHQRTCLAPIKNNADISAARAVVFLNILFNIRLLLHIQRHLRHASHCRLSDAIKLFPFLPTALEFFFSEYVCSTCLVKNLPRATKGGKHKFLVKRECNLQGWLPSSRRHLHKEVYLDSQIISICTGKWRDVVLLMVRIFTQMGSSWTTTVIK